MKKAVFAFSLCLFIGMRAMALVGTDITYNRDSHANESIVAGDIYFEGAGWVKANRVCFDSQNSLFKTTISSHVAIRCSNSSLPVGKCEERGVPLVRESVPSKSYIAPLTIMAKECLRFDYSVPKQPRCEVYQSVEKQQPVDFDFLKYKVRVQNDREESSSYEIRDVLECP